LEKAGMVKKMRRKMLLSLLLLSSMAANAQDMDCNQQVWWIPPRDAPKLPKGVCIPEGMFNYVTYIHKQTDINGDGLDDFICKWNTKPLSDGDTLYLSIYLQNPDSTFSHFRTFSHIYPIYFHDYRLDYVPSDTSLIALLKQYQNFYPLERLELEKDLIVVKINFDAEAYWKITYRYANNIKSWRYEECAEVFYTDDDDSGIPHNMEWAFGPTIDDFCYNYWVKEEP
jgi:hypothetical protein